MKDSSVVIYNLDNLQGKALKGTPGNAVKSTTIKTVTHILMRLI